MNTQNYFERVGLWPHRGHVVRTYMTGFFFSVVLTLVAFGIVIHHTLPSVWALFAILALACLQMVVQAVYFLHLGHGKHSRERLIAFSAIIIIVLILVVGSVWIMSHLNERMMSPDQMQQYMQRQPGI